MNTPSWSPGPAAANRDWPTTATGVCQYVSLASSNALTTAGVTASVDTLGDSYDNALAETINGLYTTELIHSKHRWESIETVELATMDWMHWRNTARLHETLGYHTPTEVEIAYTHNQNPAPFAS